MSSYYVANPDSSKLHNLIQRFGPNVSVPLEERHRMQFWNRLWSEASAFLLLTRRLHWIDLIFVGGLVGLVLGLINLGYEWTGEHRPQIEIDLSPWALPLYTFYSLIRGLLAYVISLIFTLLYGYWAAKDRQAERVLIPMLDILQSIPVLSFMPGLVLALVALFPGSNIGLELTAIIMIFTGQAWNMTFSFYHSLRSIPQDMGEVGNIYRFSRWQRLKWIELPFSTIGLVWNSMMSMAGGWFFLTASEAFQLGDRDFRLPGVGSYMSVAVEKGDVLAMIWAVIAMTLMIILLDQLLWRPIVVWAQKFRTEEGGQYEEMTSWFYNWLRRSRLVSWIQSLFARLKLKQPSKIPQQESIPVVTPSPSNSIVTTVIPKALLLGLLALLAFGAWKLITLLHGVALDDWLRLVQAGFWTLGRVLVATFLGTLWALPAGLAIGLSPKLSRILQPVVQVVASFPAPMLFPMVVAVMQWGGISLGWGSIVLMLLGTQWYILFNVIAGAMAIPADLKEAARSYRLVGWQRFRMLYFPAVFPYLVTGWVTAAGGAWNASIVSEMVKYKDETLQAFGLGALIKAAADSANFPLLTASTLVISAMVVLFNRLVWRQCYQLAERKYSLNK
jgi:NitT/TauT family transport system permease protein